MITSEDLQKCYENVVNSIERDEELARSTATQASAFNALPPECQRELVKAGFRYNAVVGLPTYKLWEAIIEKYRRPKA